MSSPSRTAKLTKAHKILRKHYARLAPPDGSRPLLEELLFASLLENSSYSAAERAYQALRKGFFDWNEVRVTTIAELSEALRELYDPRAAALRVKSALQSVFEATYSFDLEYLKKKPIGQAVKELAKFAGVTPFAVDHVTQLSLGGHAIPLDRGVLDALVILGVVTAKEAEAGKVAGLERVVSKSKGKEFAAVLHQLGADLLARPFANDVRDVFLAIAPDCRDRLPKRPPKKKEEDEPAAPLASDAPSSREKPSVEKGKAEKSIREVDPSAKSTARSDAPRTSPAAKPAESGGDKPPRTARPGKKLAKSKPR